VQRASAANVLNNTADGVDAGQGGGVWSAGFFARLNVSNSVMVGNAATGLDSFGGGIYSDGTTTLQGSSVLSNRVTGGDLFDAGGIYRLDGTVTLTATAVVSNQPFTVATPALFRAVPELRTGRADVPRALSCPLSRHRLTAASVVSRGTPRSR
jgi:hypothetical protein